MSAVQLYAEHLVHIRTLSIQASLPTPSDNSTRIQMSSNGRILTLQHHGTIAHLELPVTLTAQQIGNLLQHAPPSKNLNFRVPLPSTPVSDTLSSKASDEDCYAPWSAMSLGQRTEMSCNNCHAVVVSQGRIHVWKDLPSENWAEMMDFWHCHRPHEPHGRSDEGAPQRKGYSADSKLALRPDVGMVDPVNFVLHPDSCSNTSVIDRHAGADDVHIACSSCAARLGSIHASSDGYKLHKARLAVRPSADRQSQSFSEEKWLTCHLLSSISTQGVRKFLISDISQRHHPQALSLEVWIFTPDLTIASSTLTTNVPVRVTKILWRRVEAISAGEEGRLDRQALSQGRIELTDDELTMLHERLGASASLLPPMARKFQDWNVAILQRFEENERS